MGISDVIDIVIVLIIAFGAYLGFQNGAIKQISDLIILFILSYISGIISDKLFGMLYKYLPFFNFKATAQGIKSINIIFWKILLYVICIILLISIVSKIFKKIKLEDKITNTMIESGFISKIFGAIISLPLMIILMFNLLLILHSPNFNLKSIMKTKLSPIIMENIPILSKENSNLYNNQKDIIEILNDQNITKSNYKSINEKIIDNMLETKLVSEELIEELKNEDKLVGIRSNKKVKNNKNNNNSEYEDEDNTADDNISDDEDSENIDDSDDIDNSDESYIDNEEGEYEEDSGFEYEEEYEYEEDYEDFEDIDDFDDEF